MPLQCAHCADCFVQISEAFCYSCATKHGDVPSIYMAAISETREELLQSLVESSQRSNKENHCMI